MSENPAPANNAAETIFALASAPGRGGIAVLRISGPQAGAAATALCAATLPPPRTAALRTLRHPGTKEIMDRALLFWFPAPGSFTGEDVVELHVHGGRAVTEAVAEALRAQPGLRHAGPGEFTRRGFENGKFDLTAAEAIADLAASETEAQRKQALRQMDGALARLYDGWAARLTRALAHLEADIDFADEDLPPDAYNAPLAELRAMAGDIAAHLADRRGESLREGFHIAILGAPNAGKSSLLNALARREAAIVAEQAGTTRDVIEVRLDLGGYPVTLADTAGLRESADAVESEGVSRALARARAADLTLLVFDAALLASTPPDAATLALAGPASMAVLNKSDIEGAAKALSAPVASVHPLSAKTGAGMENFIAALTQTVAARLADTGAPSLTRSRHREALEECCGALLRASMAVAPELRAEDARLALRALGRITGRVDVEDLLDVIFRDFCIGK
ncbi:MAG: tRNA uridine-5-carboxymethylaminomethyl(34) synthesis GTPase MnmE [Alphaproteobacteria bacterium]|nr:tRNA uridine-5-carboxymethylaminomethyl(34) synthesis GTPase MnmE [Alphaproteobacteria bacterium]